MKQMIKRAGFAFFAILSLLSVSFAAFPESAFAAGETFTWKSQNEITVTGGDLENHTLTLVPGSNPERFTMGALPLHKPENCGLKYFLTLNGNNGGTLSSQLPAPGPVLGDGNPVCSDWDAINNKAKFPGVNAGYNGRGITIGGTRGNTPSNNPQDVSVIINSPDPASSSPDSINISIKDKDGKVVAQANPGQSPSMGSDDPNSDNFINPDSRPVSYVASFKLKPGNYLVCADIVIADCKSFTVKDQSVLLEYGDDSTTRKILVHLKVTYIGGPMNLTVGPFDVTLTKPGGAQVTKHTGTASHKMSDIEEASQGGGQVSYILGIETDFNGIDPATYEICVQGVEDCKKVTKKAGEVAEVTFTIDWLAFQADNQIERDCKDKYQAMGVKAFTFVICSVIDTGTYAVGMIDDVLQKMLIIDVNDIFEDTNAGNSYHQAWNSFRLFALGLIVIAALIMVVSQAAGVEVLSAYTVKKVMPRLLFAAIFISLSWDIMEFLARLSNDAGMGIRSLIYAPFKDIESQSVNVGGGSLFALTLIGTGAALAFGWIGLLSIVVTALISSLTALVILVVRKLVLILLFVLAPFAIAASILPNTEKLYGFWKSAMGAMLLVFPIIMSFIAIGRVVSATAFVSPGSQTVNQLIAIVAYFAPYFLIIVAIRMSGGMMATLTAQISRRSKGLTGRVAKFRGKKVQENMANMAAGRRFQDSNPLARTFNSATFGAAARFKAPAGGKPSLMGNLTAKGRRQNALIREKMYEQRRMLNAAQYAGSAQAKSAAHRDMLLRAQTYSNAATALANMGDDFGMSDDQVQAAVNDARANGGFGRDQQVYAVQRLFATGTGFNDLRQATETIHRVAGDNSEMAMSLIGEGNAVSGSVGRYDLKIGFANHAALYQKMQQNGGVTDADIDQGYMHALMGNSMNEIAGGKPKAAQNIAPALERAFDQAMRTATDPNAGYDEQGRSKQDLAKEELGRLTGIVDRYNTMGVRWASPIIRQAIAQRMNEPTKDMRDIVMQQVQSGDPDVARGYNQQSPRQRQ